jgi:hypothetical protein
MSARRCCPFDVVSRVFAERLHGRESSDELRTLLRSPAIDWERVIGHTDAQLVLPAFAAALQDLGLAGSLDEEVGAFLEAVHAASIERNSELSDELAAAVAVLNQADIEPVLLKGAIRLTDGLYPDHGWRILGDLDLLIPEAQWADALTGLQRAGYVLLREAYQEAAFERDGWLLEVHRELFDTPRQARLLRGAEVLDGSRLLTFRGLTVRLPSMDHQVVHLIGHCQIGHYNYAYGRIPFRDRLEAAALVCWGKENVDWKVIFARFVAAGYRRMLLSFLLSLADGGLCAVPVLDRIDPLTALQQWRVALQARSTTIAHISLWASWSVVKLIKWQIMERDEGGLRAIKNLKRLIFEQGASREMVRVFLDGAPRPW